ncbi:MAG: hypothetical protein QNK37_13570 [Acidobacteriota bacterium]|nr:hypothetical protein [Acidobacteriota bacterium]
MSELSGMPWHPFLVHFPVALWLFGSVQLTIAVWRGKPQWEKAAWAPLATAAVLAIPAALTGQNEMTARALSGPAMERHQDMGNLLPWLMGILVVLKVHTTLRKGARPLPGIIWIILVLAVSALVIYTASLGGTLVYGVLLNG